MTAPRLVDWDGDGDLDLNAGSFGDSYGQQGEGGGVYLARNLGSKGKPEFGPLETLIPPSPKGFTEPTRPDAGPKSCCWKNLAVWALANPQPSKPAAAASAGTPNGNFF